MYWILALISGCLLAVMIFLNGALAAAIGPVEGSLVVHGVGLLVASALVFLIRETSATPGLKAPWWAYLGGAFGAVLVIISGITVNSEIGVAGTISMLLLGQVLAGMLTDQFGWFGLPRRRVTLLDLAQVVLVLGGSGLLLYG
ncbi:MAG: DMT family transporter [Xanthomonadales bacterium]|nr:DMT family transporter [Xanthomonadales bacterium]